MKNKRAFWIAMIATLVIVGGGVKWWQASLQHSMETKSDDSAFPELTKPATNELFGPFVVAIGSFEHPEVNNRYTNFVDQLAKYLTGLREKNLTFVDRKAGATNGPAANWVMQGSYATLPEGRVNLQLKLERARGGGDKTVDINGHAEGDLNQKIAAAAKEIVFGARTNMPWFASRRTEADLHRERGVELAGFDVSRVMPIYPWEASMSDPTEAQRRGFRLQQAVRSLEASLALEPGNPETKLTLGACYETSFIERTREARKLYQQLIKPGVHDKWGKAARLRLASSWKFEDPARALSLFRQYEEDAPTPELTYLYKFYGNGISLSGEDADSDYLENLRSSFRASLDQFTSEMKASTKPPTATIPIIARVFSSIEKAEEREQKMLAFLQELKPKYPELYPYLIGGALNEGLETNAWVKAEFRELLSQFMKAPESVLVPKHFYGWYFNNLARSIFETDDALGMEALRLKEVALEKGLCGEIPEELKLAKGLTLMKEKNWKDALAIFEGLGNRVMRMNGPGPWGCGNGCPVAIWRLADQCRAALEIPNPRPGFFKAISTNLFATRKFLHMDSDGTEVWIATPDGIDHYDANGDLLRKVAFKPPESMSALVLGKDHVFIGTDGDGLIQAHRRTFQTKEFRIADGLLADHITALKLIGDKLWIGYGQGLRQNGAGIRSVGKELWGGVGYLQIETGKVVGFPFSAAKTPGLSERASYETLSSQRKLDGFPPNEPIVAFSAAADGSIFMGQYPSALRRYEPEANRWSAVRVYGRHPISSVEAGGDYLIFGQTEQNIGDSKEQNKSIWIRRSGEQDFKTFSLAEGLPHEDVTSLLVDGRKLWVGGLAYVAEFDLDELKFKQIIGVRTWSVRKLLRAGNKLWIASDWAVFSMPL